jgi:hypothetical protein
MDNPNLIVGNKVRILTPIPTGVIIDIQYDYEYFELRYKVEYVNEQGSLVSEWFSAYELEIEK